MANIKDLVEKYTKIIQQIADDRLENAVIIAHDVKALAILRIQNKGEGSDGQKFPLYSDKENMPYWLLNPTLFNAPSKIESFKNKARAGKVKRSYKALRKEYGLPVDKRTLTFDGDMFRSVEVEVELHDDEKTTVVIKAKDRINQLKINVHSTRLGGSILALNQEEKRYVREANLKRIENIMNNGADN